MKTKTKVLTLACGLILAAGTSNLANANDRRWHSGTRVSFGISVGVPLHFQHHHPVHHRHFSRPAHFYTPVYHYPPVVRTVVVTQPPVYIERPVYQPAPTAPQYYPVPPADSAPPAPQVRQYWYYCNDSRAYYPHVQQCASPWQRVLPKPG